jgi:hypothetical protein
MRGGERSKYIESRLQIACRAALVYGKEHMSWDVVIVDSCEKAAACPVTDLDDSDFKALGAADEVRQKISSNLPGVDWSDPRGIFEGDGFSIEFNVGEDDPIQSIMLHVRGGGDAIAAIMSFVGPLGWSALDCSTGEFLDPNNPSQEGWEGFQAYRDKIFKKGQNPE